MIEPGEIKNMLTPAFPDGEIQVIDLRGTRDHFRVEIKSDIFRGKSLLDQHRMVKEPLQEAMADGTIHAVEIKTSLIS